MKSRVKIGLAATLLTILVGCGGDGSGSDPEAAVDPSQDDVEAVFAAERDDDPTIVPDADALGVEIDRLFGDENAESLSFEESDSTVDVLDRARNGNG